MDLRAELEAEADRLLFMQRRPGGCESIIQLSTREVATMWFDVLRCVVVSLSMSVLSCLHKRHALASNTSVEMFCRNHFIQL